MRPMIFLLYVKATVHCIVRMGYTQIMIPLGIVVVISININVCVCVCARVDV